MKKVEFIDEGMIFVFPDQVDDFGVKKIKKSKDFPKDFPKPDATFKPSGYVMEFDYDYQDVELMTEHGIELTVKYHTGHLMRADGNLDNLKLGFNFRDEKGWKQPKVYEKISYSKGKWRGAYKIIIRDPSDPVVAWGP